MTKRSGLYVCTALVLALTLMAPAWPERKTPEERQKARQERMEKKNEQREKRGKGPLETPLTPLPTVDEFPVRLSNASAAQWAAMGTHDLMEKVKGYFDTDPALPPAEIATPIPGDTVTKIGTGGVWNPFNPTMSQAYKGSFYAALKVVSPNDPTLALFECEGQAKDVQVLRKSSLYGGMSTEPLNTFHAIGCQNAIADLLKNLDARRDEIKALKERYAEEKKKK